MSGALVAEPLLGRLSARGQHLHLFRQVRLLWAARLMLVMRRRRRRAQHVESGLAALCPESGCSHEHVLIFHQ
jgi:hypothetical protein